MKKNVTKDQEQKRKPRRLSLSRETVLVLHDPALLELVRGASQIRCNPTPATAADC